MHTNDVSMLRGSKAASQLGPAFVDPVYFPPSANLVWPNNFRHEPSTIFIMIILHILRERAMSFENVKIIAFSACLKQYIMYKKQLKRIIF